MIYLDHNATTTLYPAVCSQMTEFFDKPYNASSIHTLGRHAKDAIEKARKQIAKLIGIENKLRDYQITFTGSGTESNNLILSNYLDGEIFISATEHESIFAYSKVSNNVTTIGVNKNGVLELEELKDKLIHSKSNKKLVSVIMANNETGVIQPIEEIISIAHKFGAQVHSDCAQVIGKVNFNFYNLDLDFASISGHKFGGPIGVGALISKLQYHLKPMILGGGQEKNLRAGTENVIAITGLGAAAKITDNNLSKTTSHMLKLREKIESTLTHNFSKIIIAGSGANRLPNTSLIINPAKKAEFQLIAFDLKGIALSSGSACSSGKVGSSKVLKAMGYYDIEIDAAIRVSVGYNTTFAEVDNFLEIYREINQ